MRVFLAAVLAAISLFSLTGCRRNVNPTVHSTAPTATSTPTQAPTVPSTAATAPSTVATVPHESTGGHTGETEHTYGSDHTTGTEHSGEVGTDSTADNTQRSRTRRSMS